MAEVHNLEDIRRQRLLDKTGLHLNPEGKLQCIIWGREHISDPHTGLVIYEDKPIEQLASETRMRLILDYIQFAASKGLLRLELDPEVRYEVHEQHNFHALMAVRAHDQQEVLLAAFKENRRPLAPRWRAFFKNTGRSHQAVREPQDALVQGVQQMIWTGILP